MKYLLVIRSHHNNFIPFEWNLTSKYAKENLTTLEGIDAYTSKYTEIELLEELLELNLISLNDSYAGFAIIYNEKNKTRVLDSGVLFKDSPLRLEDNTIIDYIYKNHANKSFINDIIMHLKNNDNININNFKYILKNLTKFQEKGEKFLYSSITLYSKIPYLNKRNLNYYLYQKYLKVNLT